MSIIIDYLVVFSDSTGVLGVVVCFCSSSIFSVAVCMKTGATDGCSGLAGLGGVGVIEALLVVLLTEF